MKTEYTAPETVVVELSADTPILQFSTTDWKHNPNPLS